GLIRAYSTSTSEAIKHVGVVRRELMEVVSIKIEYPLLGKMENNLRSQQIPIETIHYLENVDIHVLVSVNEYDTFHEQIVEWTNDQASIEKLEQKYDELNVKSTKKQAKLVGFIIIRLYNKTYLVKE